MPFFSRLSPGVSNQGSDKIALDFSAGILLKSGAISSPGVSDESCDKIAQDLKHKDFIAEIGCYPFACCFGQGPSTKAAFTLPQQVSLPARRSFRRQLEIETQRGREKERDS